MCRSDEACAHGAAPDAVIAAAPGVTSTSSDAVPELDGRVIAALHRPELAHIRFRCGATWVDGDAFATVACAIRRGHIHVSDQAPRVGNACYSAVTSERTGLAADTFYLGAGFDFGDLVKLALLLHEATHAIQDYQRAETDVGGSEAAAYTTTAYFFLVNGTTWARAAAAGRVGRPPRPDRAAMDRLIAAADHAASHVHSHASHPVVPHHKRAELIAALGELDTYAGRTDHPQDFDGF